MPKYDAIIIGLGAMGSAAAYQLAKSGARVLGIDQFAPPHKEGSTHGDTRITRLAAGEGPQYVPLVRRSHEIWREIEKEVGYELLVQCGGLFLSTNSEQSSGIDFLQRTYDLADEFEIDHEKLSTDQIRERFPQFNLFGTERGYYEPEAGYLKPEKCVAAQLELALKYGATLNLGEKVLGYQSVDRVVTVKTDKGTYETGKLILTAGPWIKELLPEKADLFKIHRQVLYWFDIENKDDYSKYRDMPMFIWGFGSYQFDGFYGFPAIDGPEGGVKVATATYETQTSPEEIDRLVPEAEAREMYDRYVKRQFPGLSSTNLKAATCMYTNTPDGGFVIDLHPQLQNVIIASPCSGHGFKHSAAIGEVLAQLVLTGRSTIDISKFSFNRF